MKDRIKEVFSDAEGDLSNRRVAGSIIMLLAVLLGTSIFITSIFYRIKDSDVLLIIFSKLTFSGVILLGFFIDLPKKRANTKEKMIEQQGSLGGMFFLVLGVLVGGVLLILDIFYFIAEGERDYIIFLMDMFMLLGIVGVTGGSVMHIGKIVSKEVGGLLVRLIKKEE